MNKTLYWDIKTEVKLHNAVRKLKKKDRRMTKSKIIRMFIASPLFDRHVEELNSQLGE